MVDSCKIRNSHLYKHINVFFMEPPWDHLICIWYTTSLAECTNDLNHYKLEFWIIIVKNSATRYRYQLSSYSKIIYVVYVHVYIYTCTHIYTCMVVCIYVYMYVICLRIRCMYIVIVLICIISMYTITRVSISHYTQNSASDNVFCLN